MPYVFLYGWEEFNVGEMWRSAAEIANLYLRFVSWWLRRYFEEFREEEGVSLKRRAAGFDHSWQLQLIKQQGKYCTGSRAAVHERVCVCVCGCNLPEFPSCSRSDTNSPWISSQITLQYLPVQKTVCALDCRLILECSCGLAKKGLDWVVI